VGAARIRAGAGRMHTGTATIHERHASFLVGPATLHACTARIPTADFVSARALVRKPDATASIHAGAPRFDVGPSDIMAGSPSVHAGPARILTDDLVPEK
jgi:hypothetical protein